MNGFKKWLFTGEVNHLAGIPWTTVVKWFLAVSVVYALGSVFVSIPFRPQIDHEVDYRNIFYLHGLLVGLASFTVLISADVYSMAGWVRRSALGGMVLAVFFVMLGGIFNTGIEHYWWLRVQVLGFFSLDYVLICLILGFIKTKNQELRNSLTYWVGLLSACSALIAVLIGDLVGYALEFGDLPFDILHRWANFLNEPYETLFSDLVTSHSHQMVVAVLAMVIAMVSWKYGRQLTGVSAKIKKLGEYFVLCGTIIMTFMYEIEGFGGPTMQSPVYFLDPKSAVAGPGPSGLVLVDAVTGIGVMIGGLIIIGAIYLGKNAGVKTSQDVEKTIRTVFYIWLFLVAMMPGMGYFIELNSLAYKQALEIAGISYGFVHQDIGFFLYPALVVLVVFIQHLLPEKPLFQVNRLILIGTALTFAGMMLYVMLKPDYYGPGFYVIGGGFAFILIGILIFFKKGNFSENPHPQLDINNKL